MKKIGFIFLLSLFADVQASNFSFPEEIKGKKHKLSDSIEIPKTSSAYDLSTYDSKFSKNTSREAYPYSDEEENSLATSTKETQEEYLFPLDEDWNEEQTPFSEDQNWKKIF